MPNSPFMGKIMKKQLFYSLILFFAFGLVSCGEESPVQPGYTPGQNKKTQNIQQNVEGAAPEKIDQKYVYNPLGKRDPFESPIKEEGAEVVTAEGVPLTPLQKFDLGQLRLIGVIVGRGEPRAMVISPDGKSFILKIGTKVGKNNGVVVSITTNSVEVEEKYFDFAGSIRTGVQEIKLPKREGVK